MPREIEATVTPVTERMSTRSSRPLSLEVLKAALILQRRKTDRQLMQRIESAIGPWRTFE